MELRRQRWLLCGLCVLISSLLSSCSQDCTTDTDSCDSSATNGNTTFRKVTVTKGIAAVDLCFVVSAVTTMSTLQRWLQTVVPVMEERLKTMGIGAEQATPNRYCLVQFGGRGRYLTGRFLHANRKTFFAANEFVFARRQLRRQGDVADGYEAIEFLLKQAPFRNDPNISKSVVLVTNMGRSVLANKANLTREILYSLLVEHRVILNTVVSTQFHVQGDSGTVLGLHDTKQVSVLMPDERYRLVEGNHIQYSSDEGSTIHDYVTVALATNGSSWPIDLLAQNNYSVLVTFVKAFIAENGLERTRSEEVCQRCRCGGQSASDSCDQPVCVEDGDQEMCSCLVSRTTAECGVISPTPVITSEVTSLLDLKPTQTPRPLVITGTLDQFPGGDVELNFESTINRASYDCVLVTNGTDSPELVPCSSPFYIKNIRAGDHKLLVIGKRRTSVGTRLFDFQIHPGGDSPTPSITLSSVPAGNQSVHVSVSAFGFIGEIGLQCSLGGGPFFPCSTFHLLSAEDIPKDGVLFIVVAISNRGLAAAGSLHVEKPTIKPNGHVMVQIASVDSPDPFGRIRIRYNTSRDDVYCSCRVNSSNVICKSGEYLADPRVLGAGDHSLRITCMDLDGYIDSQIVKFILSMPPTPPPGPLTCELRLLVEQERLIASYMCDRRIVATCQVSSLPTESCNTANGLYEADISSLGPGPHVFILSVDDGFGKSLMKIHPFSIGTANRKCCPAIVRNSTVTPVQSSSFYQAQLDVNVAPGNCSLSEGFSYSINWGDSASETGTIESLSSLRSSRLYETSGSYDVEVTFCNSPSAEHNICCDSITLSVLIEPH